MTQSKHTVVLENILLALPIYNDDGPCLEELAKEFGVKEGFEPTQEELAEKYVSLSSVR